MRCFEVRQKRYRSGPGLEAEAYRLHIEWTLRQPGVHERPISFDSAANKLDP